MEDLDKKIIELMDLFDDEQFTTADQIKRPERAIEKQAIDDFMKRNPQADGGRAAFRKGGFEKMNLERRLNAYNELKKTYGKKTIEDAFKKDYGTSFENIAGKKEYKGRTVTNIIDGFKKKIKGINRSSATSPIYNEKTGHIYKTSNRFGTFYSQTPGKNQFSNKLLTENTELINNIKKDAETMSQIEVEKKYNINKKSLKKIKDQENIEFRKSYKPEGAQKKSIPYADRFTPEEKSAMYKKRKETETEEDRVKARERKKKYEDKIYKEYKMEPSSRTAYDDLWKDIARSSKDGDRIKLVEGPKYSSGASYKDFQSRVFLDTKTGEQFTYSTLKNYLNSGKLEGVTYDSVIKPYDLKNKIANSGLKEEIQKAYFGEKYKPPKRLRSQNTFHVHHIGGVAADPFSVQLTFHDQNLGLVSNKRFNTEWARLLEKNAPLSERKNYLKFVKSKTGENIAQTLEFPEVGKTRTYGEIGTNMQKLLSDDKFKQIKGLVPFMKNLGIKCQLSNGINCSNPQAYEKSLNELSTKAQAGDQAAAAKMTNFAKSVRGAGSVIKGVLGPAALVFEAGIAVPLGLFEYSQGKPATEIVDSLTYGLFGKSREDRLKEQMPAYGQVENLQNIDQRIQNLERLQKGTRGQKLRSKPKVEKAKEEFQTAAEPFLSLENPAAGMLENLKQSEDLRQKLIDEDLQRKLERKTPFDLSDPFMAAKGGRAGFKSGALRKGIQALIDKSVKSTPKDTTPDLDALIKKALDEDFFDKKDRIIDNINLKIDRARAKGLDSQEIGEGQIEFYDDITKSNFKTKTGPFFDRRKRAGGGILKQAGDSSGPPPESGPNPQGLQGLMKRGMKI